LARAEDRCRGSVSRRFDRDEAVRTRGMTNAKISLLRVITKNSVHSDALRVGTRHSVIRVVGAGNLPFVVPRLRVLALVLVLASSSAS
jgi:hypothetical protein